MSGAVPFQTVKELLGMIETKSFHSVSAEVFKKITEKAAATGKTVRRVNCALNK
jgi:hypothetical protein